MGRRPETGRQMGMKAELGIQKGILLSLTMDIIARSNLALKKNVDIGRKGNQELVRFTRQ